MVVITSARVSAIFVKFTGKERIRSTIILDGIEDGNPVRCDCDSSSEEVFFRTERFFGNHPMALDAHGDQAGVKALTPADLTALHRRLCVGPNVVLAVAGDFQPAKLAPKLKAFLARIPRSAEPAEIWDEDTMAALPAHVNLIPYNPVEGLPFERPTPETVAAFRKEIGLDKPPVTRYIEWVQKVVVGDFGESFSSQAGAKRQVATVIGPRLWNTLFLAGLTALIAVPLALLLGILAALYRNGVFDRLVNSLTLTTISFPEFFVAYMLMLFLAVHFRIFPSLSNVSPEMDIWDRLYRCALPSLTLTLVIVAHMMRMTRAAIISLMASPYIEMARLKGLPKMKVVIRHALPNAWAPIVNVIAFNLAYLVVGVVVVEVVFVYPGVGQLMVDAVTSRDIPVVQACALIFAATYILLNLLADIISIVTNPRILHPR